MTLPGRRAGLAVALLAGGLLGFAQGSPVLGLNGPESGTSQQAAAVGVRRVSAPYNVSEGEAAIFWFGRVTPSENYADVRIRYSDGSLFLSLGIVDRLLWYDTSPSTTDMIAWDSASLYLSRNGNVGETPDAFSYRFDALLDGSEPDRTGFQASYQGDGSDWGAAALPFTTSAWGNGDYLNDDTDDRGWMLFYVIPFTSLGLEGPPEQGTIWGLGLAVHDRDSAAGPPLVDQAWPETLDPLHPATWGQLAFGLKPVYAPGSALPQGTTIIRHGLDGVEVVDADVGGSSTCGALAYPGYFPTWGELNYAGKEFLNIQHVDPISEWPCFSKYYVTFPLSGLPEGKVVLSASLTLYQFGNAGEGEVDPGPQPAFIEVFTIGDDWDEGAITWNNAPLAGEYAGALWVDPVDELPDWPGIPRHWDVSRVVAEAYAAAEPLRLALYSPDWPLHSGRYFYSSDIGGGGEGRPTLTVVWGAAVPNLTKMARPASGGYGDTITYTLGIGGDGGLLTVTDTLPSGLSAPMAVSMDGSSAVPEYDPAEHRLVWRDSPSPGHPVTLTYSARVTAAGPVALINTAVLQGADGTKSASSTVVANPLRVYLPLVSKSR